MNARLLFLIVSVLTLLRWFWNIGNAISPEDAYLALCGSIPSVAYFDGPPGTALCTALGTSLAGATAFGAGLLWPLFAALTTLALYLLVAPLANERTAFSLALLMNLLPAFNLASLTPNAALPVALFTLLAMACAWRALHSNTPIWWVAYGLCVATALTFSYAAWFLVPSIFSILFTSRRWRGHFFTMEFWIGILIPILVLILLLFWNSQHGWVHFIGGTWQTALTLHSSRLFPTLTATTAAISPLVLVALVAGFILSFRNIRNTPKIKFLMIPALIALSASIYASLSQAPSYALGFSSLVLSLPFLAWLPSTALGAFEKKARSAGYLGQILRQAVSTPLFMTAVFLTSALTTFFALSHLLPPRNLASIPVVQEIEVLRTATESQGATFLIAENAALASAIALHLRNTSSTPSGHPPVYVVESPYADSQYALWPRYDEFVETIAPPTPLPGVDVFTEQKGANPFLGRSALYVTTQEPDDLPQAITAAFSNHHLLAEITTPSGAILRVFLCQDYQTLPL